MTACATIAITLRGDWLMSSTIGWVETLGSLALVGLAIAISLWKRLGVQGSIAWAALRAAVQLLAVGLAFDLIFGSTTAMLWAWLWVAGMTTVSAVVVNRRVSGIPGVFIYALIGLAGTLAITLGLLFGLAVFRFEPVTFVVLAGITLGNTMPAAVLAADMARSEFVDHPERLEGMLALGFEKSKASEYVTSSSARKALIPQIERTKVVGLIALPGAMTGMLLAGVDAFDAVLVQLVIMYLILGSVGLAVVAVVSVIAGKAFTRDGRLQPWVTDRS
jgi:putative ABC transport system permease protein